MSGLDKNHTNNPTSHGDNAGDRVKKTTQSMTLQALKLDAIAAEAGEGQGKKVEKALSICANHPELHHVAEKILTQVSYKKINNKVYIILPEDVMPKPLCMSNATPKDIKEGLGVDVVQGENHWQGTDFIVDEKLKSDTFYGKVDYYNYGVIGSSPIKEKMIPNDEVIGNIITFFGGDKEGHTNRYVGNIIAELFDLKFAGIRSTINTPLLQFVQAGFWSSTDTTIDSIDRSIPIPAGEQTKDTTAIALTILRDTPIVNGLQTPDINKANAYRVSESHNQGRNIRLYL